MRWQLFPVLSVTERRHPVLQRSRLRLMRESSATTCTSAASSSVVEMVLFPRALRIPQNVGRLGKEGMKETNDEIIKIMIGE